MGRPSAIRRRPPSSGPCCSCPPTWRSTTRSSWSRWPTRRCRAGPSIRSGWRTTRSVRCYGRIPPSLVRRDADVLRITLSRPERRNAIDAATRDALLDAFAIADADPDVQVEWSGAGPSFCSGGDLDEFGTLEDPASAHLIRTSRSLGAAIHSFATASRFMSRADAPAPASSCPPSLVASSPMPVRRSCLPELAMGLIPGAGGTVSLPRRIGRERTEWLALAGEPIDARTALDWGLVDELV